MTEQLQHISRACDGVRCDMAMLVLPDVFERTWGPLTDGSDTPVPAPSFWSAAIAAVKNHRRDFVFMAEAYWDLEWRLQQEGFDYTYDKRLYDRLRAGAARPVRDHLLAEPTYQTRSVRFLENHDEPRAAAVLPPEVHRAAAVLTYFVPGLRFFHEGQIDGRRTHVSMHVGRRPVESTNAKLRAFYSRLIDVLGRPELHSGDFRLHVCRPAWADNPSCNDLIVFSWSGAHGRLLVAVNYAPHRSQALVTFDFAVKGASVLLVDQLSDARHERSSSELAERGLYLDMSPWGYHIFDWVDLA